MKLTLLTTYANLATGIWKLDDFKAVANHPDVELILDSGAFSVKNAGIEIDLDEYCRFVEGWGPKLLGYLALDVVGDPDATRRNLDVMLSRGLKPMPVHVLGMGRREMDEAFSVSDYVACAGLRRPHRGLAPDGYVDRKMEWVAGRRVHWLGYTRARMVAKHRPFSADSISWCAGMMWGRLDVYAGRGKFLSISKRQFNGDAVKRSAFVARAAALGYDCSRLLSARSWVNDGYVSPLLVTNVESFMRYALDIRATFGTRYALACSDRVKTALMLKMVDENARVRSALAVPARDEVAA